MVDFSRIELLADSEIIEQHEFPLFGYTGLYLRCHSARESLGYDCVVVSLREVEDCDDEKLLNLVVASGYVKENSDITFRSNPASEYFYTYFNFQPDTM